MSTDTVDFNNLHILLVDDDQVVLDLVEAMLRKLGVERVTRARSGSEAFSKITKLDRVVDCVLCDYSMSPGNGLQLLQAVRLGKIKYLRPDLCFILVTGSGDADIVGVAAELDVSGYLVKPVTPEKLRVSIAKARSRYFPVNIEKYANVNIPL
ncbi:MAG: response regulator [Rhodospirillaceae bacterium]|nr:MAG: response regulator [Rhodospirillaceae bacterium]